MAGGDGGNVSVVLGKDCKEGNEGKEGEEEAGR